MKLDKAKRFVKFSLGVICGICSVLSIGLAPLFLKGLTSASLNLSLCFSSLAVALIKNEIKLKPLDFLLLCAANYVALMLGKTLFEFVLKQRMQVSVYNNEIVYGRLLEIAINDTARIFLFVTGIVYSIACAALFFLLLLFLRMLYGRKRLKTK